MSYFFNGHIIFCSLGAADMSTIRARILHHVVYATVWKKTSNNRSL